jgi:long-chain fatty acid transport protein
VFNANPAAQTRFAFPQSIAAGISYRPTPQWNLEFDVDWTDWSRLKTLTIQQAPLPDVSQELHWRSSAYYEFGVTRYLEHGWSVSGGYIFNENSLPDNHYSPLVADLNRHFLSAGVGWKQNNLGVDLAYQFGYGPERTVAGSGVNAFGQSADGRYRFISHAILLTFGWHF